MFLRRQISRLFFAREKLSFSLSLSLSLSFSLCQREINSISFQRVCIRIAKSVQRATSGSAYHPLFIKRFLITNREISNCVLIEPMRITWNRGPAKRVLDAIVLPLVASREY